MKYFNLEGEIKEDLFNKFTCFFNDNPTGDITIFINSCGGKSNIAVLILSIINSNSDRIHLVSAGCYSAAFEIFYLAKCEKSIVYATIGMYHKAYLENIAISVTNNIRYLSDKCNVDNFNSYQDKFAYTFLKKKELKDYNLGDDVYFTFKRMLEIFPNIKVIGKY